MMSKRVDGRCPLVSNHPAMLKDPAADQTRVDDGVFAWRATWRVLFAITRRTGPLMRAFRGLPLPSTSEIVELHLVGRRTGRPRRVLVGMSRIDGRMYVGHPNGPTPWLANLAATDAATLQIKHQPAVQVRSVPLRLGPERDAAIRATARQEWLFVRPFYWASQRHILRAGVYHRLDVIPEAPNAG
jgi:hypothetical protein